MVELQLCFLLIFGPLMQTGLVGSKVQPLSSPEADLIYHHKEISPILSFNTLANSKVSLPHPKCPLFFLGCGIKTMNALRIGQAHLYLQQKYFKNEKNHNVLLIFGKQSNAPPLFS